MNSTIQSLVSLVILAAVVIAGVWAYTNYIQPAREVSQLRENLEVLQAKYEEQSLKLERVQTAIKLLKVDRRIARVRVLDMGMNRETDEPFMRVEFVELAADGTELCDPRTFDLRGSLLYIDTLLVKFQDHFVEEADELRGATLCIFKSIYGNIDGPDNGHPLDRPGLANDTIYGSSDARNEFEQQIWDDFWAIANDPRRQEELGIRANHGSAPFMQVALGKTYHIDLRASGGVSMYVVD